MEKVKAVRIYVLRDTTGKFKLYLHQGLAINPVTGRINDNEKCIRWMIRGLKNPMPVHNGTWFIGFPPREMLKWFAENGYVFSECVSVHEISNN